MKIVEFWIFVQVQHLDKILEQLEHSYYNYKYYLRIISVLYI